MSKPYQRVDTTSPIPMYLQASEILRRRILSGEWPHGARIPTEAQLCDAYDVSRITIRQAIALLVRDGLLTRARGRGTFVCEPNLTAVPRSVTSFSTELAAYGMKPGSRILAANIVPASEAQAADMNTAAGTDLVSLCRLRTADGRPIGIQRTLIIAARVAGLLDVLGDDMSLYDVLRKFYGITASGATEVFHAVAIDRDDAKLLDCRIGQPGFHVTRVTFDDRGVFEHTTSVLHGDRYQIKIALKKA
ncbi:MAG: hypothetical protein BGO26_14940 [Actinobacteria bacterium 69-20]|jgi:DNA-binding GntR family transcriptional regulator|nr:GntR family transcriptional regulator [Actinomycetota bacterium]OJV29592.1 MAG: hypothetical protein BGO26_14940 [Actinobacteria bacterium 69-20]